MKAFYIGFILVMILSLAAIGLAPGLGSTSQRGQAPIADDELPEDETPVGLPSFEGPERAIDPSRGYQAVLRTDQGEIVIALNGEAPEAVNSLAFLAGHDFYDGLQFFWVLPEFTAQAGDPTCEASGQFSCTGAGGPGYTLPMEGDSSAAGRWSVFLPTDLPGSDQVHGSQLVFALTDGEFEGTVIGEVVEGQEILSSLPQRVPCFGTEPSESNPCQPEEELPPALVIEDVIVQPA